MTRAASLDSDLARVFRVLEKRGLKVRSVKVTREATEIYVDGGAEAVSVETTETASAEAEDDYHRSRDDAGKLTVSTG